MYIIMAFILRIVRWLPLKRGNKFVLLYTAVDDGKLAKQTAFQMALLQNLEKEMMKVQFYHKVYDLNKQ